MTSKSGIFKLITTISLILVCLGSYGQGSDVSNQDLSKIKVDELSDNQIKSYLERAQQMGLTQQQLEEAALARGMSASELTKLRARAEKIINENGSVSDSEKFLSRERTFSNESDLTQKDNILSNKESIDLAEIDPNNSIFSTLLTKELNDLKKLQKKIFGYSLFNQKKLTFEPSLNLATPQNYLLGPGDELIIDIWGASQQTYKQKITSEGNILISNLGPIYLNGMTIEEANGKLKKDLGQIYAGLRGSNPNTFMKISLGTVRSIKVNVVGDVNFPGTYTLPALATAFNALYVSGGISVNGSLRNIKIVRNDKTIAELDFYDFLLKGEQKNNIRLQDQDAVFVGPYADRVEIKGQVKRPGLYDIKSPETLKNLIYFAGGFNGTAYSERLKVFRKTGKENRVIDILTRDAQSVELHNGDEVLVDTMLNRFENRVEIKGAIYRSGIFALDSGMTLKQLIAKSEGIRGDAFKNRASVYRTKEDLTMEVIPIDVNHILSGESDIALQREDLVIIPSIFDLKEEYTLQIEGEVRKPGNYHYVANSTVEDLILQAGGLMEAASFARLEIARRVKSVMAENTSNQIAEIYQFQISQDLKLSDSAASFTLQPFDHVFIRRSPGYEEQAIIRVLGEVAFPGKYSLSHKTERISDIIKRAGGLTPEAYPKGGRLTRRLPVDEQQQQRIKTLKRLKEQLIKEQIKKGREVKDSMLLDLTKAANDSAIGINLDKILSNPKSSFDLILQEGDVLIIPKELQTVRITGEVLYPIVSRYEKNQKFKKYISNAGGFGSEAKKSKSYVIYANGSLNQTHKILFFNHYPKIEPGAEIVVPQKTERKGLSTGESISIATALSSLALIIVTVINSIK